MQGQYHFAKQKIECPEQEWSPMLASLQAIRLVSDCGTDVKEGTKIKSALFRFHE
jgi:hypothetical protein